MTDLRDQTTGLKSRICCETQGHRPSKNFDKKVRLGH